MTTAADDQQKEDGGQPAAPRPRRWGRVVVAVLCVLAAALALALGLGLARGWQSLGALEPERIPVADVSSERLLGPGSIVGFADQHETHAWIGIPFAAPPDGELRWRAPRRAAAWGGTFDALDFGPPCSQLGSPLGGVPAEDDAGFAGSEDCLYLNVWAPRAETENVPAGEERWPVMVWIHGGGNVRGYPGSPMYDGALLAGREQVVVVSIAYRLGPLGWFSHPALREESADALEASGNFGLLDQISALEWVQSNISEFGGDPEKVTLFGESAGGQDIYALMLAEPARGLFHRAIVQSGVMTSVSRAEAENPVSDAEPGWPQSSAEILVSLIEAAGVVPDREAARGYAEAMAPRDVLEFLRGLPVREILEAYRDRDRGDALVVPRPIRDGALLPNTDPLELFRSGAYHAVPFVAGSNRDEMKLYLSQDDEHVWRVGGVFYHVRDFDDYDRRAAYHSDFWAVEGVARPLDAMAASGARDLYAYRFDWDELPAILGQPMSRIIGAAHGFEIPILFGTFDLGDPLLSRLLYPKEERGAAERLSHQMMSYWAEFARSGRPGRGSRGDQPEWESWLADGDGRRLMRFDSEEEGGPQMIQAGLSREQIARAVRADAALSPSERCELLADLLREHARFEESVWRSLSRGLCPLEP